MIDRLHTSTEWTRGMDKFAITTTHLDAAANHFIEQRNYE